MSNSILRSRSINSQAFDHALEDFKVKHRGKFHIPASNLDCTTKALQSRFNPENPAHKLGAWDMLVAGVAFNDFSLFDAILGSYFNRGTHEYGSGEGESNVLSLLVKSNKQGGDLMFLYDKFMSDGVLDAAERAELKRLALEGIAQLQGVIASLDFEAGEGLQHG
jgi:hypothetical protein